MPNRKIDKASVCLNIEIEYQRKFMVLKMNRVNQGVSE